MELQLECSYTEHVCDRDDQQTDKTLASFLGSCHFLFTSGKLGRGLGTGLDKLVKIYTESRDTPETVTPEEVGPLYGVAKPSCKHLEWPSLNTRILF